MTERTNANSSSSDQGEIEEGRQPTHEAGAEETEPVDLTAEVERLKTEILYARAETENVRRRLEAQAEERGRYAVAGFAREMLQVSDNLRRALDAAKSESAPSPMSEGVELTERTLHAAFERYGVKRILALGQRFDPNLHQAMIEIEDPNQPTGTVVAELQPGYTIHGRLLREAMVSVSKGGPKGAPQPGVDTTA
ncbi:protein GrpE [Alphaproteobacteria bacterium]|nr:protein GrpE [Alphaproteobacteria bacterium]